MRKEIKNYQINLSRVSDGLWNISNIIQHKNGSPVFSGEPEFSLLHFSNHLLDKGNVGDCDIAVTIHIGNR